MLTSSLFVLMPVSLLLGGFALFLFAKAIKNGWFEDVEGPKYRMLDDDPDDEPTITPQQLNQMRQGRGSGDKGNAENGNNDTTQ